MNLENRLDRLENPQGNGQAQVFVVIKLEDGRYRVNDKVLTQAELDVFQQENEDAHYVFLPDNKRD